MRGKSNVNANFDYLYPIEIGVFGLLTKKLSRFYQIFNQTNTPNIE
jgi:hypothetical protein